MPIFNNLVEKKLNLINFFNIYSIPYIIIFLAAVSFTAGGYPPIFLSRYDPVKIFRKTSGEKNKSCQNVALLFASSQFQLC